MGQDRWVRSVMAMPLEDVAAAVSNHGTPGSQNALAAELVVQVRAAVESARAADESRKTAEATRRLVMATWVMAVATLCLAIVTAVSLLMQGS